MLRILALAAAAASAHAFVVPSAARVQGSARGSSASRPALLLLDEPTQGMSHADTQATEALIRKLAKYRVKTVKARKTDDFW